MNNGNLDANTLLAAAISEEGTEAETASTVFDINAIILGNDLQRLFTPDIVRRLACLPALVWLQERTKLRAKFRADLCVRELDKAVRNEQAKLYRPNQPRNGVSAAEGDWQSRLLLSDSLKVMPCYENVALFLQNHSDWDGVLGYNELTAGYEVRGAPPQPVTAKAGTEIEDHFDTEVTRWLEVKGLMVKPQAVRQVIDAIARENSYHPVRDYLNSLPEWDGTPRAGSWLIDYCGVASSDSEPNFYAMAVGEKFLISAIARVMQPGCKADHLLILEGEQGIGKSSAARILAGGDWFTDQLDALGGKDAMMQLRGVWIVELPELDVLGRAEMSRAKAFLSAQVERFRVPYGRRVVQTPRQCVFIGTTNHDSWLKDETGGRRFWPVKCLSVDLEGLARDRDQIWAEALQRYRDGAHWWLEEANVVGRAKDEQKSRYQEDPWQDLVIRAAEEVCDLRGGASIQEILAKMGLEVSRQDQIAANRAARCLRMAGWEQYRQRRKGKIERRYGPPTEQRELLTGEGEL